MKRLIDDPQSRLVSPLHLNFLALLYVQISYISKNAYGKLSELFTPVEKMSDS